MSKEAAEVMLLVADWIDNFEHTAGIPLFPIDSLVNSEQRIPTFPEVSKRLRWHASQLEHPAYIDVYRAICGWQTKLMVWDPEGFYDCFNTGMGPYGHTKEGYKRAVGEGRSWAEDEGVEFKTPPNYESLVAEQKRLNPTSKEKKCLKKKILRK